MSASILVADNDRGMRDFLEEILQMAGYRVLIARDGLEALNQVEKERPHLILLDIGMPKLDGYGFAAELQRRSLRTGIRILVLSAATDTQEHATRLGADGYVVKPFELEDLMQEIDRLLE